MRWMIGLAALAACGGSDGPLTVKTYAAAVVTADCKQALACGAAIDLHTCEQITAALDTTLIAAAIAAGKITFDAAAASACVAALAARSCDTTNQDNRVPPADCAGVLTGAAAVGDPCALDAECASESCELPSCGSACCQGSCVATRADVALGGTCARDAECAAGGWCKPSADGTTMSCVPLLAANAQCFTDTECDYGLACFGGDGTLLPPGTCTPGPHVGDPCNDEHCADVGASCDGAGTCVADGLVGAPCGATAACSPLLQCVSAACVAYPTVGQPCSSLCSDGTVCFVTAGVGTCTAPQAIGAACTSNRECTSDYCAVPEEASTGACATNPLCI